jgi:hypothetical protein
VINDRRKEISMRAFLLALVLVVGVAATAWAAIPDSSGAISGCYAKKGGKLRVVKAGKTCKKTERSLVWSQTGPAGAPGAKGPAGPKGVKGDPGTPSVAYATVGSVELDDDGEIVGELELPAGKYLLLGTALASNGNAEARDVTCVAGILPEVTETVPAEGSATFTAQFAIDLPAATSVGVFCFAPDTTELLDLTMALTAVRVGSIVQQ